MFLPRKTVSVMTLEIRTAQYIVYMSRYDPLKSSVIDFHTKSLAHVHLLVFTMQTTTDRLKLTLLSLGAPNKT